MTLAFSRKQQAQCMTPQRAGQCGDDHQTKTSHVVLGYSSEMYHASTSTVNYKWSDAV